MRFMHVWQPEGHKIVESCAACNVVSNDGNRIEPAMSTVYDSYRHAYDDGWRFTHHVSYCPPTIEGVWVCPDCLKDPIR
jgi:cytochrome c2